MYAGRELCVGGVHMSSNANVAKWAKAIVAVTAGSADVIDGWRY
jgi:hypothetical protein